MHVKTFIRTHVIKAIYIYPYIYKYQRTYMYVYIIYKYLYICVYIYTYIYIYVPVYAPESSKWQFCAPNLTFVASILPYTDNDDIEKK
jgi:hypothetical protein